METFDVSDPINAQKQIFDLNTQLVAVSKEYRDARCKYAECHYNMKKALSSLIPRYQQDKKNLGVDMAILKALDDKTFKDKDAFNVAYKGYIYYEALYKGVEKQFDAIQGQIMSIQSLLKYYKSNDGTY